jgi:hypothetical protein
VTRRTASILLFSAALCSAAWSDVLFLKDGTILIGTIVSSGAEGTRYQAFGREVTLLPQDIKKTAADVKALEHVPLTVQLMEGSVLHGTVADYDPEVGLFLDISFGVLTIPVASIKAIMDPTTEVRHSGSSFGIRAGGSWYFPILDAAKSFASSPAIDLSAQWRLPFLLGLTAGFDARYSFSSLVSSGSAKYSFISVEPEVGYRLLVWRNNQNLMRIFTPFVSLGAGAVYVNLSDPSASPEQQGEMNLGFNAKTGLDVELAAGWGLRLQGRADLYLQKKSPFLSLSAGLMATFDM